MIRYFGETSPREYSDANHKDKMHTEQQKTQNAKRIQGEKGNELRETGSFV